MIAKKMTKADRFAKMKLELIDGYLSRFGLTVEVGDAANEASERAEALAVFFKDEVKAGKYKPEEMVKCDVCQSFSPNTLDECPFCGETDEPPGDGPEESAPVSTEIVKAEPAPKIVKTTSKKVKAKAAAQDLIEGPTEVHDSDGVILHTVATERDLDQAVERIDKIKTELMRVGTRCGWEMGNELREIHARKLFLQRLDPKTKVPKFKTFAQFVTHEIKITPNYAYQLMDIAVAFTKEDVEQIAMRKLRTILTVPDEYRDELKQRALAGASTNELAQAVDKVMDGRPLRDTGRKGFRAGTEKVDPNAAKNAKKQREQLAAKTKESKKKKTDEAAAKGAKDRPADAVTVLMARRTKVKLFKAKLDSTGKPMRALRVVDDAHGSIDLWNNTKLHVRLIMNAKKELEVVIDVERPNATS